MPSSAKPAPPQQASLGELWKKGTTQRQPHSFGASPANATPAEPSDMDIDGAEVAARSQSAPTIVTAGTPITLPQLYFLMDLVKSLHHQSTNLRSLLLQSVNLLWEVQQACLVLCVVVAILSRYAIVTTAPKGKRRRILDSDDEVEVDVPPTGFFVHAPKPMLTTAAITVTHSPKVPEDTPTEGKRKGNKTKVKHQLNNDLMKVARNNNTRVGDDEEVPAACGEGDHMGEEDDFLASDGEESQAAVKNAKLAISHVIDVDIDGGWKEGSA